jgi:gliding motility-associated-like protein
MRKFFSLFLVSLLGMSSWAAHIKGGFFQYEYLGPGTANPSANRYRITLTIYMSCEASGAQISDPVNFTIYNGISNVQFANPSVAKTSEFLLSKAADEPCISGNQAGCYYKVATYVLNNYELPANAVGYTISYQRCCRIGSMDNIQNSANVGNTYTTFIPGNNSDVPNAPRNSSPRFPVNDTAVVCANSPFSYPFSATDPNGDSLVYFFCTAFQGGSTGTPEPNPSAPPPFPTAGYIAPFSGISPMGSNVTINPRTGVISGIAPNINFSGEFGVTVCVFEYRNGLFIGESRKELHIRVRDCVPIQARLNPEYLTCDGFTLSFVNNAANPTGTSYEWNFGDPSTGALNTSTSPTPTHTFSDTGTYTVKLKVSLNGLCGDSTIARVRVYPGFFPQFRVIPPLCRGVPIFFRDETRTDYGTVTGWRWDFGVTTETADTSILPNPSYTFANAGNYNVQFIVGNTFGCRDTISQNIVVANSPTLSVARRDTIYCALDSVQLQANGTGNFSWQPASFIQGSNTSTPSVFPPIPTTYVVTLESGGCFSRDSVRVTPRNDLTNSIAASSISICEEDTITLTGSANYTSNLTWNWSPATSVSQPNNPLTQAFPRTNTTYTLSTRWGRNCVATATRAITVRPLALPNAGPDQAICVGQDTVQLQATGGNSYVWTPAAGLSATNIPNPRAFPTTTTDYIVSVGVTGCTKRRNDTVRVAVRSRPTLTLPNDTLICTIDTLRITALGTGNFLWSPNYMISSLTGASVLVSPDLPTTYQVQLTDAFGCIRRDSIWVDVRPFVSIFAGNDTTICRGDAITIPTVSDALTYQWSPATFLSSATIKQPRATPTDPVITYRVVGNIGKCQSSDEITIRTVPYPQANAGNDTTVCFGDNATLRATGGRFYAWSPTTFLSSPTTANTSVVRPLTDTRYVVTVTDNLGCPKPVRDSVWVRVYPIVVADAGPRDTTVVIGQPLQLNGTGAVNYQWSPGTWLSNPNLASPIATPQADIEYRLTATTQAGCVGRDSIRVRVYNVPPSFYVPSGFSPNNDGRNDVFRPILLGMRSLNYFQVYNRWGQLVFQTTQQGKGWDGRLKGNPQDPGTYVWMAQGETYTGQVITQKGSVVLIR